MKVSQKQKGEREEKEKEAKQKQTLGMLLISALCQCYVSVIETLWQCYGNLMPMLCHDYRTTIIIAETRPNATLSAKETVHRLPRLDSAPREARRKEKKKKEEERGGEEEGGGEGDDTSLRSIYPMNPTWIR